MTEEKKAEMWLKTHKPYACERCGVTHQPARRPEGLYSNLTKEEQALWDQASDYEHHEDFEVGSEKAESLKILRGWIKPGDTVYAVLRHVSSSGMCRHISLLGIMVENGKPRVYDYTFHAARVTGWKMGQDTGGLVLSGCGMDMGFHAVFELSRIMFEKFTCIGEGCPSNDHSNGDRSYEVGRKHSDGGYALRQKWL